MGGSSTDLRFDSLSLTLKSLQFLPPSRAWPYPPCPGRQGKTPPDRASPRLWLQLTRCRAYRHRALFSRGLSSRHGRSGERRESL